MPKWKLLMRFDAAAYGPGAASILALDGSGERLMPLARGRCCSEEARTRLRASSGESLFRGARNARAALSGLYLYFSCLDESHEISQSIKDTDGSFWHAIMHRQEPDSANAAYWFRRVGRHPIFPALSAGARAIAAKYPGVRLSFPGEWDPFAFTDICSSASGEAEQAAREVQRLEWQLLFDVCARPVTESI